MRQGMPSFAAAALGHGGVGDPDAPCPPPSFPDPPPSARGKQQLKTERFAGPVGSTPEPHSPRLSVTQQPCGPAPQWEPSLGTGMCSTVPCPPPLCCWFKLAIGILGQGGGGV